MCVEYRSKTLRELVKKTDLFLPKVKLLSICKFCRQVPSILWEKDFVCIFFDVDVIVAQF